MLLAAGCVLCEAPQGPVCASCAARLHRAGPLPQGDPPARALLGYEGAGRELVTCLKYRNGRPLVGPLGRLLAELAGDVDAEVVTWVPASRAGRRHRGFDQGRLLARATARSAGLGVAGLLRRGPGPSQTGRPAADRRLGPALTAPRSGRGRVIIVDDVITTGSTLRVAAVALRRAGWQPVLGLSVAATPRLHPDPRLTPPAGRIGGRP